MVLYYLLAALVYFQIGFHLGRVGRAVWRRQDNLSVWSFIVFPVRHCAGKVGRMTSAFGQSVHDEDGQVFHLFMVYLWPVVALANVVAITFLLPGWLARRFRQSPSERLAAVEAESRALDAEIHRLEAGEPVMSRIASTVHEDDVEGDVRINVNPIEQMHSAARERMSG